MKKYSQIRWDRILNDTKNWFLEDKKHLFSTIVIGVFVFILRMLLGTNKWLDELWISFVTAILAILIVGIFVFVYNIFSVPAKFYYEQENKIKNLKEERDNLKEERHIAKAESIITEEVNRNDWAGININYSGKILFNGSLVLEEIDEIPELVNPIELQRHGEALVRNVHLVPGSHNVFDFSLFINNFPYFA